MSLTLFLARRLEAWAAQTRLKVKARFGRFQDFLALSSTDPAAATKVAGSTALSTIASPLNCLIVLWIFLVYWGEVLSFDRAIDNCDWHKWETWPTNAHPHHVALVADPQLVDPHTYPGRSWPLSTLTIKHTDLYMRRSYSRIQRQLDPNTIFFLGDLFDGGREWSTPTSQSPDYIYRKYGDEYWLREYERFSSIFLREWKDGPSHENTRPDGRQIIASLPGNHDLGFARGVRKAVRDRFNSHFGDGNRIDVIGNHTFISMDTVSLSAEEQPAAQEYEEIWQPPQEFLNKLKTKRYQAISGYLHHLRGTHNKDNMEQQNVFDIDKTAFQDSEGQAPPQNELPTIFLTHVPFYRGDGEPCGPLRERSPPTPPPAGKPGPVYPDEPNAIAITAGYQYQNVLSGQISTMIAKALDGAIEYVFSGDDHDYCEVVHHGYEHRGSGIREITVKSISEAMGVRKPGFLLVSLWNPINLDDPLIQFPQNETGPTVQTKLCLLPDEVGIVIRYACLIGASLLVLLIRAFRMANRLQNSSSTILPTYSSTIEKNAANGYSDRHHDTINGTSQHAASASSSDDTNSLLSSRNPHHLKSRSQSPLPTVHNPPTKPYIHPMSPDEKHRAFDTFKPSRRDRQRSRLRKTMHHWLGSIWRVLWVVVVWYLILWHW